ncbi:hypothetical protein ABEB36_013707 [Hypothenemus hampei]|uniref:Uncharacterized protein n=1 Tax=Hypothenemus hampei TaxID=57062 RepID=A0ABD1E511_HYPHA
MVARAPRDQCVVTGVAIQLLLDKRISFLKLCHVCEIDLERSVDRVDGRTRQAIGNYVLNATKILDICRKLANEAQLPLLTGRHSLELLFKGELPLRWQCRRRQ